MTNDELIESALFKMRWAQDGVWSATISPEECKAMVERLSVQKPAPGLTLLPLLDYVKGRAAVNDGDAKELLRTFGIEAPNADQMAVWDGKSNTTRQLLGAEIKYEDGYGGGYGA